jgi:hypothetical protein
MKFFITQFSPNSCYFISVRSKYSPQHLLSKHPQFKLFPLHTYKTTGKIMGLYTLHLKVFGEEKTRQNTQNGMVAAFPEYNVHLISS